MFKHFRSSERVFIDREIHQDWMIDALERCKERSVVLHLHGIGGIGKTALVEHWKETTAFSMVLDCGRVTAFYDRLDTLAKAASHLGIKLQRFDILWHVRQRFVLGVEPTKEHGREWALDALAQIPFIGTIANISSAIHLIGAKLGSRLSMRVGQVGEWLRTRLGKDYGAKLLEILWQDHKHAELLFLDALLEDLCSRKNGDQPIMIVLDHFENVDSEDLRWHFKNRKISETELWYVFLSSLSNSVGVVACRRRSIPKRLDADLIVEEIELTELDQDSCRQLLESKGILKEEIQTGIISVSSGNPFILDAICDLAEMGALSIGDVESLRADSLEEVRVQTWKRLFSQAENLVDLIDRAGLLPFFDRQTLSIVYPSMKTDHWNRLLQLSFVKDRGDGTLQLHDLAKELVIFELGNRLPELANEMAELLHQASETTKDITLLGLAISIGALSFEDEAITKIVDIADAFFKNHNHSDVLTFLSTIELNQEKGKAVLLRLRGRVLAEIKRVSEAELALRGALDMFRKLVAESSEEHSLYLAETLSDLGFLLSETGRPDEAETYLREAVDIFENIAKTSSEDYLINLADTLWRLGITLLQARKGVFEEGTNRFDAEAVFKEGLEIYEKIAEISSESSKRGRARTLTSLGSIFAMSDRLTEAGESFRQAYSIFSELAEKNPEAYTISMTMTLSNQGGFLTAMEKPSEAEEVFQEAIIRCRELVEMGPEHFKKYLATSLVNLGLLLMDTARPLKAEKVHQEALEITSDLFDLAPEVFIGNHAMALHELGWSLLLIWKPSKAEAKIREAIQLWKDLLEEVPDVSGYGLPWPLSRLGTVLGQMGRPREAEETLKEAIEILREWAERHLGIAWLSNSLAPLLRKIGRYNEAEETLSEGVSILREQVDKVPHYDTTSDAVKWLAIALNSQAILLGQTGRHEEAESLLNESLEIYTEAAQRVPAIHLRHKAHVLHNLGVLYRRIDNHTEAERKYKETLDIKRQLAQSEPDVFNPAIATTLNNYAILLRQIGKHVEAEQAHKEALEIRQYFAEKSSDIFLHRVATSQNNLGVLLLENSRLSEAADVLQTALRIRRDLVNKTPALYLCDLASTLNNTGVLSGLAGNYQEGQKAFREALSIYEKVKEFAPAVFEPLIARIINNLAVLLSSEKGRDDELETIVCRLNELGITKFDSYLWSEDEEEEDIWF